MATKIRVLDEHTINKIAAGEVIENPASVVKELVENSIDAEANEITIEIKGGGRQLIRITDNGLGMSQDDAVLCLERHATSKIREVEDIHLLMTMGFRGEAIPSIASISKFTILTRQADHPMGTMVLVEGGRLLQAVPAACAPGTTMEVKSLFYNIPVRKKFQKSPNYDTNEILKMVNVLALAHPSIRFHLISNEKTLLDTSQQSFSEELEQLGNRIETVLGLEFSQGTTSIQKNQEDFKLLAYFGQPNFTRPNKTGQYLFINRRAIQSPLIFYHVKESYGTALSPNRYPIFVLHLTIPGNLVDVNVHPQKKEVRLRQEEILKNLIHNSVKEILESGGVFQSALLDWDMPSSSSPFSFDKPSFTESFSIPTPAIYPLSPPTPKITLHEEMASRYTPSPSPSFNFQNEEEKKSIFPKILGTISGYILIDATEINPSQEGLYYLHQKNAHARLIYEQLLQTQAKIGIQHLLIPHTIHLTPSEIALLNEHLPLLQELGFHFYQSGVSQFCLDALPEIIGNVDVEAFAKDLLVQLQSEQEKINLKKLFARQIALSASRLAISNTSKLSFTEAQNLVKLLYQCQNNSLCPVGHPIMHYVGLPEISKKFHKV